MRHKYSYDDISEELEQLTRFKKSTIRRVLAFYLTRVWLDIAHGQKVKFYYGRDAKIFLELIYESDAKKKEYDKSIYDEDHLGMKLRLSFIENILSAKNYRYTAMKSRMRMVAIGCKRSRLFDKLENETYVN